MASAPNLTPWICSYHLSTLFVAVLLAAKDVTVSLHSLEYKNRKPTHPLVRAHSEAHLGPLFVAALSAPKDATLPIAMSPEFKHSPV